MDTLSLKKHHYIISALAAGGLTLAFLNISNETLFNSTDQFVLLASEKITLATDIAVSSGDIVANSKKGILTVGSGNALTSNLFASRITLGPQSVINGSATFNNLTKTKNAKVFGEESKTFSSPLVDFPVVAPFQTGATVFRTKPSETATLQQGTFKSITTGPDTILTLEAGTYSTETLTLGNGTTIHFLGAATINIKNNATIGNNIIFSQPNTLPIDSIALNSTGKQLSIGTNSMTHGIITAPDATITIGQNTLHRGQLIGRHIVVGRGAILSREESFEKESDMTKIITVNDTKLILNEAVIIQAVGTTLNSLRRIAGSVNGIVTGFIPNLGMGKIEVSVQTIDDLDRIIDQIKNSGDSSVEDTLYNILPL